MIGQTPGDRRTADPGSAMVQTGFRHPDPSLFDAVIETPLGPLGIRLQEGRLAVVAFLDPERATPHAGSAGAAAVARMLDRYFADPRQPLRLPLAPAPTPYQSRVRNALLAIPPGETRSYGQLAAALGSGARAVAGACRANPLPILVPCHRVVAAAGPGGYAGARTGRPLQVKQWLLRHEHRR